MRSNSKPKGQQTKILLGYRRKSVVRQAADEVSLEAQTEYCNQWLALRKRDEYQVEWYEDIDRSGRDEKNRPGWQALLSQLDRPDVAGVISYSFSRMYRNLLQFLTFLDRCEQLNLQILTVKETIDTSSAIGRAMVSILMLIYQLESDQTSERMTEGIQYRREVLGRHWGPLPFGAERDDEKHLIPTPRTYRLNGEERRYIDGLRFIYELYATNQHGMEAVAQCSLN